MTILKILVERRHQLFAMILHSLVKVESPRILSHLDPLPFAYWARITVVQHYYVLRQTEVRTEIIAVS
jgi:hypothetical protein